MDTMLRSSCLRHFAVALFALTLGAGNTMNAQQAAGPTAPLPMPQKWDTAYVILLEVNPAYVAPSESAAGAVIHAHIQYQLGLLADGRAIRGGPIADASATDVSGITILTVRSKSEAQTIAEADPGVRSGRFHVKVRTWTTPAKN